MGRQLSPALGSPLDPYLTLKGRVPVNPRTKNLEFRGFDSGRCLNYNYNRNYSNMSKLYMI